MTCAEPLTEPDSDREPELVHAPCVAPPDVVEQPESSTWSLLAPAAPNDPYCVHVIRRLVYMSWSVAPIPKLLVRVRVQLYVLVFE